MTPDISEYVEHGAAIEARCSTESEEVLYPANMVADTPGIQSRHSIWMHLGIFGHHDPMSYFKCTAMCNQLTHMSPLGNGHWQARTQFDRGTKGMTLEAIETYRNSKS